MIRTARLRLTPVSLDTARADIAGREALARALGVRVPSSWPPEHMDAAAIQWSLDRLAAGVEPAWLYYYAIREDLGVEGPVVVGTAGYTGAPDETGSVELGYSIVPEHRRLGLASEAVAALVERAFEHPAVQRVIAETMPALLPSIGVLARNGFHLIGDGTGPGTIRYELTRGDHDAGRTWTPAHAGTLVRLLDHMLWADRLALDALDAAPADARARQLYDHVLAAEAVWLARLRGETPPRPVWPDLGAAGARRLAGQVMEGLRAFVWQLLPEDLDRLVAYRTSAGTEHETRVEDILLHICLHGSHHRGQVAALLRAGGATPPATDYIGFVRGAAAARTAVPPPGGGGTA